MAKTIVEMPACRQCRAPARKLRLLVTPPTVLKSAVLLWHCECQAESGWVPMSLDDVTTDPAAAPEEPMG